MHCSIIACDNHLIFTLAPFISGADLVTSLKVASRSIGLDVGMGSPAAAYISWSSSSRNMNLSRLHLQGLLLGLLGLLHLHLRIVHVETVYMAGKLLCHVCDSRFAWHMLGFFQPKKSVIWGRAASTIFSAGGRSPSEAEDKLPIS